MTEVFRGVIDPRPIGRAPHDAQAATSDPTLQVSRYAEILAHTVYFGRAAEPEILARLSVDKARWSAAGAKWTSALVDEALADEHPVAGAFAAAFAPVLRRLKVEKPGIETLGAFPRPPHVQPEVTKRADAPGKLPVDAGPAPKEQPTFLAAREQMQTGPAAPAGGQETRWARWAGVGAAATTTGLDGTELLRAALPFMKKAPGTDVAKPSERREGPPPQDTTPSLEAAYDPSGKQAVLLRPSARLAATAFALDVPRGPDLPFAGSAGKVPASAPPAVPELTVEQYASFRARLSVNGEDDARTWEHFGVTSTAAKDALQARFAARFHQDPAAQARFIELLRKLADELRTQAAR